MATPSRRYSLFQFGHHLRPVSIYFPNRSDGALRPMRWRAPDDTRKSPTVPLPPIQSPHFDTRTPQCVCCLPMPELRKWRGPNRTRLQRGVATSFGPRQWINYFLATSMNAAIAVEPWPTKDGWCFGRKMRPRQYILFSEVVSSDQPVHRIYHEEKKRNSAGTWISQSWMHMPNDRGLRMINSPLLFFPLPCLMRHT